MPIATKHPPAPQVRKPPLTLRANPALGGLPETRDRVTSLRMALGLPRLKFARLLGRTERAVIDWESGRTVPQGLSRQRLREQERFTQALGALFDKRLFGAKQLGEWFDTPNEGLDRLKPIEVIERGEMDRLWRMISELETGGHV
jgi:transcriptional regulator with XRE-family HTH domain